MTNAERASIARLFTDHRDSLLARARRILRSEADAEDVVQEVMLAVLRGPDLLSGVERVLGWLMTLVHRRAVDLVRRNARHRRLEGDDEVAGFLHRDDVADPEASEAAAQAIAAALAELPDEQARAFAASALEGKTFREMSEQTGTPAGTLMARKKRAADHIRARLREWGFRVPDRGREGRAT